MSAALGLVVTKRFTYRGDATEEFSNKYWLTGAAPSTDQAWHDLATELANHERTCYLPYTKVVSYVGYNDNDEHAHSVWTYEYPPGSELPGTLAITAGEPGMSGDQAGLIEWRTARKNSRGKWVYLRKYLHGGARSASDIDGLSAETVAAYEAFAAVLFNGTMAGGRKVTSQHQLDVLTAAVVHPYVTTRTLKRRGKRP